jgi:tetratricopeptide (TPR) repeat protein
LNRLKLHTLLFLLLGILSLPLYAQQGSESATNHQLGLQYYRNKEYQKAAEVFEQLYNSNRSNAYYSYYLNSLIQIEAYDKAENLVKSQIRFDKFELSYYVDLGNLYSLTGNETKAKASYESAIGKLQPNQHQVIRLANAFMMNRLYAYAEACYFEGKKLMKGAYGFQMDLAQLYYYMRDYDKMIAQYLDLLRISDMYLNTVQARLQNAVYNDIDNSLTEKLKQALFEQVNKHPDVLVYSEMLVWLFIQDNDFEMAFIQAKALDMRLNENGQRLLSLARAAAENNDFDVAIQAYEYVIAKGKFLEYYFAARNELLEVMYKRIVLGIDNRYSDYVRMEESFITALHEMGPNLQTIDLLTNLAHLQAFYLGKTVEARFLLEDAITLKGLNPRQKGEIELELADIYLLDNDVWEATLAYARVEDDNKNNPVGSEAKFRKGRLAYFIGNFQWAQAQLDVLKASTSKLIANDAANLAFFIYENSGWDTVETALETYARADLLFYQSKDSLALLTIDSVIQNFSSHELIDDAWFLKARINQRLMRFTDALICYQYIAKNFYNDVLADNALFAMADIYEHQLKNNEKAMELYKQIMLDFADSIYRMEARTRFRRLRGDDLVN